MKARLASLAGGLLLVTSACHTPPLAEVHGRGFGASDIFPLAAGTYRIDWTGWDDEPPKDGCLLGLAVELTSELVPVPATPKITYRNIPAGTTVAGRTDSVALFAGRYRVQSEGSCGWEVRFTPVPPKPGQ